MEKQILVSTWVLEQWAVNARGEQEYWIDNNNDGLANYFGGRAAAYEFLLSEYAKD
jgi:hypothetical protein